MNKLVAYAGVIVMIAVAAAQPAKACDGCREQLQIKALEYLQKYDDPAQRVELRQQELDRQRRSHEEFARQLGLDAQRFTVFVETLADQVLELRVAWERCYADLACEAPPGIGDYWPRHQQQLGAILGQDGLRQMHDWTRLALDRRFVNALAARMPGYARMTAEQKASLVAVVGRVRDASRDALMTGRYRMMPYGECDALMLLYADAPTVNERMASAREFVLRLKDEARSILGNDQLTVFDQMQAELLANMRQFLVEEDTKDRRRLQARPGVGG